MSQNPPENDIIHSLSEKRLYKYSSAYLYISSCRVFHNGIILTLLLFWLHFLLGKGCHSLCYWLCFFLLGLLGVSFGFVTTAANNTQQFLKQLLRKSLTLQSRTVFHTWRSCTACRKPKRCCRCGALKISKYCYRL